MLNSTPEKGRPPNPPQPQANSGVMSVLEGVRVLRPGHCPGGPYLRTHPWVSSGLTSIKIDDPSRPYDAAGNVDVNRGKRSIQLDLKSERGKEVFWKLVDSADVVVENNRKGAMERMGLGYEEVSRRKPTIVYASLNAFGYDGPWSQRPGWEQLAQATSGIQVRRGGRDAAPKLLPYPHERLRHGVAGSLRRGSGPPRAQPHRKGAVG